MMFADEKYKRSFVIFLKRELFVKNIMVLLLCIELYNSTKYTFNKFTTVTENLNSHKNLNTNSNSHSLNLQNKEKLSIKTNMESSMRNYAMNLANTKLLKISFSSQETLSERLRVRNNNKSFNQEKTILQTLSGSVMISIKGELTFSREFLEDNNTLYLKDRKLIARARYTKSLNQIGWSRLYVETFDNTSAEIQSWAAGYLEGKICAPEILDFYKNLVGIHSKETTYLKDVFDYYKKVEESIRYRTSKPVLSNVSKGKELEYWISVAMIQAQTDGLLAGYNSIMISQPLNFAQIYFINADGEVPELLSVFKFKKERRVLQEYSFRENRSSFDEKTNLRNVKNIKNSSSLTSGYRFKSEDKFSKEYLLHYFGSTDPDFIWEKLMSKSHCSAIIKVVKDENFPYQIKDVLIGHTTWDSFSEMHRIFKNYKFSYTMYDNKRKNSNISFSSYPGTLTSTDDFYVLNKKIVVTETTLEMLDKTLYESKIPVAEEHVPNYIRISVANRLSNSGKEWTEIFRQNNGGTYNSQWMIFDFSHFGNSSKGDEIVHNLMEKNDNNTKDSIFSKFSNSKTEQSNISDDTISNYISNFNFNFKQASSLKKEKSITNLPKGFFYLMEQIPGYIEIQDLSEVLLRRGFWASYNRPYFDKISKDAGYFDMLSRYGKTYSYEDNPRSRLINSRINSVKNFEDMKFIMQNNKNIQGDDYLNTISPRYDLTNRIELRRPAGGIDTKIVSFKSVSQQTVYAISGPSTQNGATPFSWSNWIGEPHYGLPEHWNFGWNTFDQNFVKNG